VTYNYNGQLVQTERNGNPATREAVVWWYRFTTTAANTRVRFDILSEAGAVDLNGNGSTQVFDSYIRLFNAAGRLLALNGNRTVGADANGSATNRDSFLGYRNFATPGTYLLAVGATFTRPNPAPRTTSMSNIDALRGWQPVPTGTSNAVFGAPFRLDVSVNRGAIGAASFNAAVPEPGTLGLLGLAAAGAAWWRRRRTLA
jgi:hypothetical protein